jgi:hypothetical protein
MQLCCIKNVGSVSTENPFLLSIFLLLGTIILHLIKSIHHAEAI